VGEPAHAGRWLARVWDAVDSLELWPRRGRRTEDYGWFDGEVRRLVVGRHLLLFTVDDERRTVWILGLRDGRRLPRPEDLPRDPGSLHGEGGDESGWSVRESEEPVVLSVDGGYG
jgi:hypothetical protein